MMLRIALRIMFELHIVVSCVYAVFCKKLDDVRMSMFRRQHDSRAFATDPRIDVGSVFHEKANDFLVSKNDYVRLKNLVIGYSPPERIIKKWGMTKFRLFLSGENLVTFTNFKFKNIDPEQSDFYSYPMYRIYNLGININF